MSNSVTESLQGEIYYEDAKFQRACSQVVLLNTFVQELQTRYDRAVRDNLRTYRYALRLRLCTVEGIRNMYYEYATATADKIEALENRMRELGVEPAIIYAEAANIRNSNNDSSSSSSTNSQENQVEAEDDLDAMDEDVTVS